MRKTCNRYRPKCAPCPLTSRSICANLFISFLIVVAKSPPYTCTPSSSPACLLMCTRSILWRGYCGYCYRVHRCAGVSVAKAKYLDPDQGKPTYLCRMGTIMSTPGELFLVWQDKTACIGENEKSAFPVPQPVKETPVIARSVIGKLISFAAVDLLVQSSWAELATAPQPLSHCLLCLIACDFFGSCSVSVRFLILLGISALVFQEDRWTLCASPLLSSKLPAYHLQILKASFLRSRLPLHTLFPGTE